MQDKDLMEFSKIMYGLADNFSAMLTDDGIDMRYEALKEYDIELIKKAAHAIVKTRKYTKMPTIADFVEHIEGNPDDKATLEATKVWNAISQVGAYDSVVFDDPVTMAVIEQGFGGWVRICKGDGEKDCGADQRVWFCKEFEKIYKSYRASGIQNFGKLIGLTESENLKNWFFKDIPAPKLIGDREKAAGVLSDGKKLEQRQIQIRQWLTERGKNYEITEMV